MTNFLLETKLESIKEFSTKQKNIFSQQNINSIKDLLHIYPYKYENYSSRFSIRQIIPEVNFHCVAKIISLKKTFLFRKRTNYYTATLGDQSGKIKAIWFNQPYIANYLKENEEYLFFGKATKNNYGLSLVNPLYFPADSHPKHIMPIYPQSGKITGPFLSKKIDFILENIQSIPDYLPDNIKQNIKLIDLDSAIRQIHQPSDPNSLSLAINRLGFDEIFLFQLNMLLSKINPVISKTKPITCNLEKLKKNINQLPFELTNYQKKSLWEIIQDMDSSRPMNRLLQGDVGSGKTIVAALASIICTENKFQTLILAPTEILANQHYLKLKSYFPNSNFKLGLLTSKKSSIYLEESQDLKKSQLLEQIKKGKIDIIVSTQAALQKNVVIPKLNLLIVDEQHRFGVVQRNFFQSKKQSQPHTLTMSATPIPRSLALTLYSHLSISTIKSSPKNRLPIITKIVSPGQRQGVYNFIDKQINEGRQVYVICPLIEESEKLQIKSAKEMFEKIKKEIFPHHQVGLIHGKMKSQEKEQIMADFNNNKLNVLVSTSVIEVGIDVPNANIIIIEGAERFGLAQMHQMRGRVGRGAHQSYCFLCTDLPSKKVLARLKILENNNDGFEIAEQDLKLRGPGDLAGFRQSGLSDFRFANLANQPLIKLSNTLAKELLSDDPDLSKYPYLKQQLDFSLTNLS